MTAQTYRASWSEGYVLHEATRLERLERLYGLAVNSEMNALPCTVDRFLRGVRADRIARALRAERAAQGPL